MRPYPLGTAPPSGRSSVAAATLAASQEGAARKGLLPEADATSAPGAVPMRLLSCTSDFSACRSCMQLRVKQDNVNCCGSRGTHAPHQSCQAKSSSCRAGDADHRARPRLTSQLYTCVIHTAAPGAWPWWRRRAGALHQFHGPQRMASPGMCADPAALAATPVCALAAPASVGRTEIATTWGAAWRRVHWLQCGDVDKQQRCRRLMLPTAHLFPLLEGGRPLRRALHWVRRQRVRKRHLLLQQPYIGGARTGLVFKRRATVRIRNALLQVTSRRGGPHLLIGVRHDVLDLDAQVFECNQLHNGRGLR